MHDWSAAGAMLIVFNPAAGARRRRRLERALALLPAAAVAETARPGHAEEIARDAARAGARIIVAAGGDGTVGEVAAGIAGTEAALGLLPMGTANVLAHELGIPLRPEGAAWVLATGRTRCIWPGIARYAGGGTRVFVQMLGAGFDAAVVAGLDLRLKRVMGRAAYVAQAMMHLGRYGFPPVEVIVDGAAPLAVAAVVVTKGRFYAGRHLLAPGATPLAPGFRVALMTGGRARAALAGAALPLDLLPLLPGMKIMRAARVELRGEAPLQADGDPAGRSPASVEDAPAPVRIILPREGS